MNYRIVVHEPECEIQGTAILLTGRGGKAESFIARYKNFLFQSRLVAIQPLIEWYPLPNGAHNQDDAVAGLALAVPKLKECFDEIINQFNLNYDEVSLVGFSAGAVMALQLGVTYSLPVALIVLHNGAILEPEKIPEAKITTPIMLVHSKNDDCFSWEERYIPMKNYLIKNDYKLFFIEKMEDNHMMTEQDVYLASCYMAEKFKYTDSIPYKATDYEDQYLV